MLFWLAFSTDATSPELPCCLLSPRLCVSKGHSQRSWTQLVCLSLHHFCPLQTLGDDAKVAMLPNCNAAAAAGSCQQTHNVPTRFILLGNAPPTPVTTKPDQDCQHAAPQRSPVPSAGNLPAADRLSVFPSKPSQSANAAQRSATN